MLPSADLSFGAFTMTALRQRLIDDLQLRGFSPYTQKAYVQAVARFARHFKTAPDQLGPEEVRQYLLYLVTSATPHGALTTSRSARCGSSTRPRWDGRGSWKAFRVRRSQAPTR